MVGSMSIAIETINLARSYRTYQKDPGLWGSLSGFWNRKYSDRVALAPANLQIEAGQTIGLVGANGAGKTTLIKILSGLIIPSGGSAKVLGFTPWERDYRYLKQMSVLLGQKNQLWWDLAPQDSYQLLADIYELDSHKSKMRVQELAEMLDCVHVLKTQLRRLSLGERMKMEIIGCLLHDPKILFLDEPTIGLDIVAQTAIRKFISGYVKEKKPTIILTSHYMDDIAKLADRLLLISQGKFVYDGTVSGFSSLSERKQKISFSLGEPLSHDLTLGSARFPAGQIQFEFEVTDQELSKVMNQVTSLQHISDLKLEQVDFEEVILDFLRGKSP
jgi:ABC-2 type transport system ATP-binding protein